MKTGTTACRKRHRTTYPTNRVRLPAMARLDDSRKLQETKYLCLTDMPRRSRSTCHARPCFAGRARRQRSSAPGDSTLRPWQERRSSRCSASALPRWRMTWQTDTPPASNAAGSLYPSASRISIILLSRGISRWYSPGEGNAQVTCFRFDHAVIGVQDRDGSAAGLSGGGGGRSSPRVGCFKAAMTVSLRAVVRQKWLAQRRGAR